jgi:hypothetical protein
MRFLSDEAWSPAGGRARDFSVRHSAQSGSAAYPVSYALAKEWLLCQSYSGWVITQIMHLQ